MASFLLNRDYLIELDRTLNDLFEEELARNEKIRIILLSNLNEFFVPACVFTITTLLTIMMFIIPTFVEIMQQIIHLRMPANYHLPLQVKYPWDIPNNALYHMHLLYENCSFWFLMFVTCGVDGTFGFYAYQISSVLRTMTFRLANPLPEEKFSYLLRTCVETHKQLLRCREYLEHVYGPIILWTFLSNAVLMCSLIFATLPVYADTDIFKETKNANFSKGWPKLPVKLWDEMCIK